MSNGTSEDEIRKEIRSHPLYPVLKILQTKCDQALWNGDVNTDMDDVYELLEELKMQECSIVTSNPQMDSLMSNSILELKRHLKEIHQLYQMIDIYVAKKRGTLMTDLKYAPSKPLHLKKHIEGLRKILKTKPRKSFTIREILDQDFVNNK